jgi:hypothetical protein
MINWFPLPRSLMENPIFIMSTPLEKLYLLHIASELNLRGPFYKADLEAAVTLRASEDKIRRTRRSFMRLGWIQAKPGFRSKGRHLPPCTWALRGQSERMRTSTLPFTDMPSNPYSAMCEDGISPTPISSSTST